MTVYSDGNHQLEDVRWLVQHADAELAAVKLPSNLLSLAKRFRRQHGSSRSRLLCELHDLRNRAGAKFRLAAKMFFNRLGYEQATSEIIANYKAQRFSESDSVVDLCSGIGGDAISLSRSSSRLTLVDRSATMMELALANLHAHGLRANVKVAVSDVREIELSPFDAWHLDPDRRVGKRKRSAPNTCEPPLDDFLRISGLSENGAVKLSPAANAGELLDLGAELEWIGNNRECQQLVVWFGALARHPGKRTATLLQPTTAEPMTTTLIENSSSDAAVHTTTPRYVYEPRPCVLAAGLEDALAQRFGLWRVSPNVPYLASNECVQSDLLQRFETVEMFAYRSKALKQKVKQLNLRVTEVKMRGVDISPADVLNKLPGGIVGEPAVAMLFPINRSIQVLLARRSD